MPNYKVVPESPLGQKLLDAIGIANSSQAKVSRHFKVTPSTVSGDWIKRGTIGKEHYPELVNYFGLPYEYWFGEVKIDAKLKEFLTEVLKAWPHLSGKEKDQVVAGILKTLGQRQR